MTEPEVKTDDYEGPDRREGEIPQSVPIILWAILGLLVLLVVAGVVFGNQLASNTTKVEDSAYDNRLSLNQGCQSGNVSRETTVEDLLSEATDLRDDADNLRADARFYENIVATTQQNTPASEVISAAAADKRTAASEKDERAVDKETRAKQVTESIRDTALFPNAPELTNRAIRDCDRVYPVPSNPTDPLPKPTLPAPDKQP
jgi:cytoskeletal protein RodZ